MIIIDHVILSTLKKFTRRIYQKIINLFFFFLMRKMKQSLEDVAFTRNFDIITNETKVKDKSPQKQHFFPPIESKISKSIHNERERNRTLNSSAYDFDIISQRKNNNRSLLVKDENVSPKKVYHLTRFREEGDINGIRYRRDYEAAAKDKAFNKKKGWIKEYIGNEVNTINHCLKRF